MEDEIHCECGGVIIKRTIPINYYITEDIMVCKDCNAQYNWVDDI